MTKTPQVKSFPTPIPVPQFKKVSNFNDIDEIPYDSFEYQEDLIKTILDRTDDELIKYSDEKIYFVHPTHKRYACDIFGSIYDIEAIDPEKLVIYCDKIFIECSCGGVIIYDYIKFKNECLKLKVSDFYKQESKYAEEDEN